MVSQTPFKVGNTVCYIRTNEYANLIRSHSSVDVFGAERRYWKVKWFNKKLSGNDDCYYSETLLRLATEEEIKHYQELKDREEYAMRYL